MLQARLPRALASLEGIFELVGSFAKAEGLEERTVFEAQLVLEELFTNQLKYNPAGSGDIEIRLERTDRDVILTLRDPDAERFDPGRTPEPDTSLPLAERRAGGLGLFLVRRIARTIGYEYRGRCSTITVTLARES